MTFDELEVGEYFCFQSSIESAEKDAKLSIFRKIIAESRDMVLNDNSGTAHIIHDKNVLIIRIIK